MSKILRRCLSSVLAIMLLASLFLNASLNASADNKTGEGLAAHAMQAYNEGWSYVWGGSSPGGVDCSGLIYSYVGSGARTTEDMLNSSSESGYVSDGVPEIPGLGLWQPGHVGVYVGGGMAVDARDEISNVCYQSVATKSWVMWFKVNGVSYNTDSSVANDNQKSEDDNDSVSQENSFASLSVGSSGYDVQQLQQRLKELGYFDEDTTLYFGNVTQAALIDFQKAAGIEPSGVYDEQSMTALTADDAPFKAAQSEDDCDSETDIQDSDESEIPDDIEENVNIPNVGEELNDSDDDSTSEDIITSDETQQDSDDQNTDSNYEQSSQTAFEYYDDSNVHTLKPAVYKGGDSGKDISSIQYMLEKLSYYYYDITGEYDEKTASAVEFFQLDNKLDATGYIDEDTLFRIFENYSEIAAESDDFSKLEELFPEENNDDLAAVSDIDSDSPGVIGDLTYDENSDLGTLDESTEYAASAARNTSELEASGSASDESVSDPNNSSDENAEETDAISSDSDENTSDSEANEVVSAESESSDTEAASANEEASAKTVISDTDSSSDKSADTGAAVSENKSVSSAAASTASSQVKSPKTGDPFVMTVKNIIDEYVNTTFVLAAVAVSLIAAFFFGTVHYWNVSMEKRRQRARKATTVSVYRRGSM